MECDGKPSYSKIFDCVVECQWVFGQGGVKPPHSP